MSPERSGRSPTTARAGAAGRAVGLAGRGLAAQLGAVLLERPRPVGEQHAHRVRLGPRGEAAGPSAPGSRGLNTQIRPHSPASVLLALLEHGEWVGAEQLAAGELGSRPGIRQRTSRPSARVSLSGTPPPRATARRRSAAAGALAWHVRTPSKREASRSGVSSMRVWAGQYPGAAPGCARLAAPAARRRKCRAVRLLHTRRVCRVFSLVYDRLGRPAVLDTSDAGGRAHHARLDAPSARGGRRRPHGLHDGGDRRRRGPAGPGEEWSTEPTPARPRAGQAGAPRARSCSGDAEARCPTARQPLYGISRRAASSTGRSDRRSVTEAYRLLRDGGRALLMRPLRPANRARARGGVDAVPVDGGSTGRVSSAAVPRSVELVPSRAGLGPRTGAGPTRSPSAAASLPGALAPGAVGEPAERLGVPLAAASGWDTSRSGAAGAALFPLAACLAGRCERAAAGAREPMSVGSRTNTGRGGGRSASGPRDPSRARARPCGAPPAPTRSSAPR